MRRYLNKNYLMFIIATSFICSAFVFPIITTLIFSVLPSFNNPAPSCVLVYYQTSNSLALTNNCGNEQKVNIRIPFSFEVLELGGDRGVIGNRGGNRCITLPPKSVYLTAWRFGKFDRLESCRFRFW